MSSNESLIYAYTNLDFSKAERYEEEQFVVQDVEYYTVRRGDNLGKIANKYKVSVTDLKKWNSLKSNNIGVGKKLRVESVKKVKVQKKSPKIPEPEKSQDQEEAVVLQDSTTDTEEKLTSNESETDEKVDRTEVSIVEEGSEQSQNEEIGKEKLIHKVQKGESLFSISKQYQVSIDDLKKWNQMEDSKINIGMELSVFRDKMQVIADEESTKESKKQYKTYVVQKGDSLYSISQKNKGVTITDLKKWNALRNNEIKPGMKLIVQKP
jgi:membrane-bound lytic murein transglycosylase D